MQLNSFNLLYKGKYKKEEQGNYLPAGSTFSMTERITMQRKFSANFCVISIATDVWKSPFNSREASSSSRGLCSYWTGNAIYPLKFPSCSLLTSASHCTKTSLPLEMLLELNSGQLQEGESWVRNWRTRSFQKPSAEVWTKNTAPRVPADGLKSTCLARLCVRASDTLQRQLERRNNTSM